MSPFPNSMGNLLQNHLGSHVSIIMRTKDRPVLLVRAFASVLSQKHQDWQLYLVNDGGNPDAFEAALAPYRAAFGKKLTIIQHETSLGMEAASNAALEKMRQAEDAGDGFVIVHDDDDAWHPDFLLKTVSFLQRTENRHFAGVITNCETVQEKIINNRIEEVWRGDWGFFRSNISYMDLLRTNCAPPICFLIRRDVVDKIGSFNADMPVLGDWDFILRVMAVGDIATWDEKLAYYHHRVVEGEGDVYANTVTTGFKRHQYYNTLYTNAMIRADLQSDSHSLGLFRFMAELRHEIILLHTKLDALQGKVECVGLHARLKRKVKRWKEKWRQKR